MSGPEIKDQDRYCNRLLKSGGARSFRPIGPDGGGGQDDVFLYRLLAASDDDHRFHAVGIFARQRGADGGDFAGVDLRAPPHWAG